MLDGSYLILGLDALSRAHAMDYFADGHRGAAMVSAYFMCAEEEVEEGVSETIRTIVDRYWAATDLCAPLPDEVADDGLLARLIDAVAASVGDLRMVGHNVIFPSLALKAFREAPDAVTPSRVAGIIKLVEAFDAPMDISTEDGDEFPDLGSTEALAEFVLEEYALSAEAFIGRGQGWTGHMLTVGRAVIDYREAGHEDLARTAMGALKQYVKRSRMGPLDTDKQYAEHGPMSAGPTERAYWEKRREQDPTLGHCIKNPYGFLGLMARANDAGLKQQCLDVAFRVL